MPLAVPLAGAYLLLFVAFRPGLAAANFARRGDFSYGLYLYAFPVQMLLARWFRPALTPTGLFLAASAITLGFAFLSWHLVERPFLRLKRSSRAAAGVPVEAPAIGATATNPAG